MLSPSSGVALLEWMSGRDGGSIRMNSCRLLRNGGTTNRPGRVTLLHGRWLEVAIGPAGALLLFRCLIFCDNLSLHALTCSTFLFLRFPMILQSHPDKVSKIRTRPTGDVWPTKILDVFSPCCQVWSTDKRGLVHHDPYL